MGHRIKCFFFYTIPLKICNRDSHDMYVCMYVVTLSPYIYVCMRMRSHSLCKSSSRDNMMIDSCNRRKDRALQIYRICAV